MKAFTFKWQAFTIGPVKLDEYSDITLSACNVLDEFGDIEAAKQYLEGAGS